MEMSIQIYKAISVLKSPLKSPAADLELPRSHYGYSKMFLWLIATLYDELIQNELLLVFSCLYPGSVSISKAHELLPYRASSDSLDEFIYSLESKSETGLTTIEKDVASINRSNQSQNLSKDRVQLLLLA